MFEKRGGYEVDLCLTITRDTGHLSDDAVAMVAKGIVGVSSSIGYQSTTILETFRDRSLDQQKTQVVSGVTVPLSIERRDVQ